jgi:hypothetical protein
MQLALAFIMSCAFAVCKDEDKFEPTPIIYDAVGYLSAYNQLPTAATTEYRQKIGDIPKDLSRYDALLAVDDCGRIGHEAKLFAGGQVFEAIVFDCGGAEPGGGWSWMQKNNIVAETDYWFWQKYPELIFGHAKIVYQ